MTTRATPRTRDDERPDRGAAAPRLRAAQVENIMALRPAHKALLLRRRAPAEDPGFQLIELELEGALDVERMRTAWQARWQAHPALRMCLRAPYPRVPVRL